jgi:hypothetical protein
VLAFHFPLPPPTRSFHISGERHAKYRNATQTENYFPFGKSVKIELSLWKFKPPQRSYSYVTSRVSKLLDLQSYMKTCNLDDQRSVIYVAGLAVI